MDYWNLNTLWFALIAILWMGFFFLEGFDFGVGILQRFVARNDSERRVAMNAIGPVWDGNEVWLLVAGGATFAAFPEWYATLFSGMYLALFLVLVALVVRAVSFEFRSKLPGPGWRRIWDEALFWGSAVPALLFGVAFANMVRGVPIGPNHEYAGTFIDLLSPYALLGGLTTLLLFTEHGAMYLALKTRGDIARRALRAGQIASLPALLAVFAFLGWTYLNALGTGNTGVVPGVVPIASLGAAAVAVWLVRLGPHSRPGWGFTATGLAIVLLTSTIFLNLYPRVLVSSVSPLYDLTIFNAASSPYTLGVMSIVALIFVPLVLAYQGWTYWVFRQRISTSDLLIASFAGTGGPVAEPARPPGTNGTAVAAPRDSGAPPA